MSDKLAGWVERKQYSQDFISTISNDLKHREERARSKVRTTLSAIAYFITHTHNN